MECQQGNLQLKGDMSTLFQLRCDVWTVHIMRCDLVEYMMTFALTCTCSQAASTVLSVTPLTTAKLIANLGNTTLLNRLRPLAAGTATIAASFGGLSATPLAITIGSTGVTMSTVTLSANWCTSNSTDVQCGVTFAGLPGATNVLQVRWL